VTLRTRSLWGRLEHLTSTKATTVTIKTYEGYVSKKLTYSPMSVMDRILDAESHTSFGFLSKNGKPLSSCPLYIIYLFIFYVMKLSVTQPTQLLVLCIISALLQNH
jgi:hypothetical protein